MKKMCLVLATVLALSACSQAESQAEKEAVTVTATPVATEAPAATQIPTEAVPEITPIPMPDYTIKQDKILTKPEPPEGIVGLDGTSELKPYAWIQYGDSRDLTKFDFKGRADLLASLNFSSMTQFPDKSRISIPLSFLNGANMPDFIWMFFIIMG